MRIKAVERQEKGGLIDNIRQFIPRIYHAGAGLALTSVLICDHLLMRCVDSLSLVFAIPTPTFPGTVAAKMASAISFGNENSGLQVGISNGPITAQVYSPGK